LSLLYRNSAKRITLGFARGEVADDAATRARVFGLSREVNSATTWRKTGAAVIVGSTGLQGMTPDGGMVFRSRRQRLLQRRITMISTL